MYFRKTETKTGRTTEKEGAQHTGNCIPLFPLVFLHENDDDDALIHIHTYKYGMTSVSSNREKFVVAAAVHKQNVHT